MKMINASTAGFPPNPHEGVLHHDSNTGALWLYSNHKWQMLDMPPFSITYRLFIDDERDPSVVNWGSASDVKIARTVDEAIALVEHHGLPVAISFDHDLGDDTPPTMDFMWYLINSHLDGKLDLRGVASVMVHSANPIGAENLVALWNGFAEQEGLKTKAKRVRLNV
jgi:hypothetical protein